MTPRAATGKAIAVIQAHHTDLLPGDTAADHYCIAALRGSQEIGAIVIAAADIESNRVFVDLAAQWGVELCLGPELDVVRRIIQAVEQVGGRAGTPVARVLLNRFYLDAQLVDRSIAFLRSTASDFVMLPYDFDINFGADVFTLECLKRVDQLLTGPDGSHSRFRPWLFIEDHPEAFKVVTFDGVPSYPRSVLDRIRASGLFAERDCGTFSPFTYQFIGDKVSSSDVLLDIACGAGDGTAFLAKHAARAFGCDLSPEIIAEAKANHQAPNLSFDVQDGCALSYPDGLFSLVVCSNTLEHVPDDRLLLDNLYRVLQSGGRLILETPLLRKRPFNFPVLSSHLREYEKSDLLALLADTGFTVGQTYGMNRGMYVDWSRARESALVEAQRQ